MGRGMRNRESSPVPRLSKKRNLIKTMKTYSVRASTVRRAGADKPVSKVTIVPSVDGFPGESDEVTLQPGQWLEIIKPGSPETWSQAIVRP